MGLQYLGFRFEGIAKIDFSWKSFSCIPESICVVIRRPCYTFFYFLGLENRLENETMFGVVADLFGEADLPGIWAF